MSQAQMYTQEQMDISRLQMAQDNILTTVNNINLQVNIINEEAKSTTKQLQEIKTDVALLKQEQNQISNVVFKIEETLFRMDSRIHSNFKWIMTMTIGFSLSLLGVVARGFHWI